VRPEAVIYAAQALDYMDVHGGGVAVEDDVPDAVATVAESLGMDAEQFILTAVIQKLYFS
jgi:hypothetical protein